MWNDISFFLGRGRSDDSLMRIATSSKYTPYSYCYSEQKRGISISPIAFVEKYLKNISTGTEHYNIKSYSTIRSRQIIQADD
jgi:hypothetical protein